MVTYEYTCDDHGPTEVNLPMGTAPATGSCRVCEQPARRVFARPMVSTSDQTALRIIDSTKATSDRPMVVTSLPPTRRSRSQPPASLNPLLKKLPRP